MSYTVSSVFHLQDNFTGTLSNIKNSVVSFGSSIGGINNRVSSFGNSIDNAAKDVQSFNQALDKTEDKSDSAANGLTQLDNRVEAVNSSFGGLRSTVASVLVALGGFEAAKAAKGFFVDSNADMETYQNTLNVVMKDTAKAKEMLDWSTNFAAKTPFEIPELVEGTVKLQAYGLEAKKVMGATGDMASVMGKPLMQAIEAVADAQTGELERLKEFGITKNMIESQAQKMNLNVVDKKGSITDMEGFNAALFALMEDRYKGGMEIQSTTYKGMVSNAKDFIGTMGREFGKPIFAAVSNGLRNVLSDLAEFKESGRLDSFVASARANIGSFINVVQTGFRTVSALVSGDVFNAKVNLSNLFDGNVDYSVVTTVVDIVVSVRDTVVTVFHDVITIAGQLSSAVSSTSRSFEPLNNAIMTGLVASVQMAGQAVTSLTGFLSEHSVIIETAVPFVIGYAGALALVELNTLRVTAVTKGVTLATAAWNAIINLNPFVAIATAIIGASILIYQNWDYLKLAAQGVWLKVREAFGNVKLYVLDSLQAMIDAAAPLIEYLPASIASTFNQLRSEVTNSMNQVKNEIASIQKEQATVKVQKSLLNKSESTVKFDDGDDLRKEKMDRRKLDIPPIKANSGISNALSNISKSTSATAKNTEGTKKSSDDILQKLNIDYTDLLMNNIRKMVDTGATNRAKQAVTSTTSSVLSHLTARQQEGYSFIQQQRDNSQNMKAVDSINGNGSKTVVVQLPKYAEQIVVTNDVDKEALLNEMDERLMRTIKETLANS